MANVTIKEIAGALGVSRNTVSKVVNGKGGVLPETARRIIEAALEMGYTKIGDETRRIAGVPAQETEAHRGNIAVVSAEANTNYFWMNIINGVSRTLTESGYGLLYMNLDYDQIQRGQLPRSILQENLEGIIVANVYHRGFLDALCRRPVPRVHYDMPVDCTAGDLRGDVIFSEGRSGIRTLVRMLAEKGRTRFGFIGDPKAALSICERWEGFLDGLEDCGLEPCQEFCFVDDRIGHYYTDRSVINILRRLTVFPDVFVCANDSIALRVINFLAAAGIAVPQTVAVTGYDGIAESLLVTPHLTTIRVDNEAIGRRLARQLLWRIQEGDRACETIRVEAELLVRESTP